MATVTSIFIHGNTSSVLGQGWTSRTIVCFKEKRLLMQKKEIGLFEYPRVFGSTSCSMGVFIGYRSAEVPWSNGVVGGCSKRSGKVASEVVSQTII